MNSFDGEIRRLRSAVLARQTTEPGPDCPSSEEIWQAVGGELAPFRGREIVDHALGCRPCTVALRVANDLATSAGESERPSVRKAAHSRLIALAAAAALALVVVLLPRLGTEESASHRGAPFLERSHQHSERLPSDQVVLRWRGHPTLSPYTLRVRWLAGDSAGEIWDGEAIEVRSEEVEISYRVPPEDLESVPAGARLYWTVEIAVRGTAVRKTFSALLEK